MNGALRGSTCAGDVLLEQKQGTWKMEPRISEAKLDLETTPWTSLFRKRRVKSFIGDRQCTRGA